VRPGDGLAGVVLAAGAATRFGGPKQVAQWRGVALVRHAAHAALAACPAGVVVVTGAHAQAVAGALAGLPLALAHNPRWAEGLATSLACGLGALPPGATACLVLPCDLPRVEGADLGRLAAAWAAEPGRIAAAWYDGHPGTPAVFPAAAWPELRALRGDAGARGLLAARAAAGDLTRVELPAAGADVDTPADLVGEGPARGEPGPA